MEYVEGQSLDVHLRPYSGGDGPQELDGWLRESLEKLLSFLLVLKRHEPGFYYTDFKPHNIRISPESEVRLLDAGSVFPFEPAVGFLRSPRYVPKELRDGRQTRSDLERISLVGLGRTVYHSLLNKEPNDSLEIDVELLDGALNDRLADWLTRACANRFDNIESALEGLPQEAS
jgi:serine/threonine protein kinase